MAYSFFLHLIMPHHFESTFSVTSQAGPAHGNLSGLQSFFIQLLTYLLLCIICDLLDMICFSLT